MPLYSFNAARLKGKAIICLLFSSLLFATNKLSAQSDIGSLHIETPAKDTVTTRYNRFFFTGRGDKNARLFFNGQQVKIFKTGSFAQLVEPLQWGYNSFTIMYISQGDTLRKNVVVNHISNTPAADTQGFAIAYVKLLPEGTSWLLPGDQLTVEMKATPGQKAFFSPNIPLEEINNTGIYRGTYPLTEKDTAQDRTITATLQSRDGKISVSKNIDQKITVLATGAMLIGQTNSAHAYLAYGYGDDRLGGAKMGFLDSAIELQVTGKIRDLYRVQLSNNKTAYVPVRYVTLLPQVHQRPSSLTGNWNVSPQGRYDQILIHLDKKLPYSAITQLNPSRLVVDIYGAISNTNWITQLKGLKAIKNTWYEQIEPDVFRVYIDLQKPQLWGYKIGYEQNNLVIAVKAQPENLSIAHLTIGLDAGHGGSNLGAEGLTGVLEKDITLAITLKLQKLLTKAGAHVLMTRTTDTTVDMGDRVDYFNTTDPDLLVSIHCNSASPDVQGNSTYYRYIAFRPLSQFIHDEMLKLGFPDYGNVGSFNFGLSGPTQYINALNETAFISNPEEESKLLDEPFQQKIAQATYMGIRKFLQALNPDSQPSAAPAKKNKKR